MPNSSSAVARPWLGNLGIALCSTVLTFALIEGAFRLTAYYDERSTLSAFQNLGKSEHPINLQTVVSLQQIFHLSENPRVIYEFIPNLSFILRNKQHTMNAHGFRGPEYNTAKEERVLRVVGIGDSVMWGWGVSDNEYYLALLSEYLNQSSPVGYHWEIINTAVPGYNTVMEVEAFKDKGLLYSPNLVIIDFVDNDLSLPNFIRKKENYLSLKRSFAAEFLWSRLNQQHLTYHDGLVDAPSDAFGRFESDPARAPTRYKDLVGPDAYRAAMTDLTSLSRQHGFQVVVFTHAYIPGVLKAILSDLNLPVVEGGDVLQEYMAQHGIKEYLGSPLSVSHEDPHPSALGHSILADVLYRYLQAHGILAQMLQRRGIVGAAD